MKKMLVRLGFFLSLTVGCYFVAYRGSESVSSWLVQYYWENRMTGWTLEYYETQLWLIRLSVYVVMYLWAVMSALPFSLAWNLVPILRTRKAHTQGQRKEPGTKGKWVIAVSILLLFGTVYVLGTAPMAAIVFAFVMLAGEYLYGGGGMMDHPRLAAAAVPTV